MLATKVVQVRPLRIVGYLSPKGHYGHLGAYEHEVLVTSGVAVKAADH